MNPKIITDHDLYILSHIRDLVNRNGMHFILTGSYAIQAITGNKLNNNDLDANIYVLGKVAKAIQVFMKNVDTLEFIIKSSVVPVSLNNSLYLNVLATNFKTVKSPRKLELTFYETTRVSRFADTLVYDILVPINKPPRDKFLGTPTNLGINGLFRSDPRWTSGYNSSVFSPDSHRGFQRTWNKSNIIKIPTVMKFLHDSNGFPRSYRVKTLLYNAATWTIRVSGYALNQKRVALCRDKRHLALLLQCLNGDYDGLINTMVTHPQMPPDKEPIEVFNMAKQIVRSGSF